MELSDLQSDVAAGLNPLALVLLLLGGLFLLSSSRHNGLKALLGVTLIVPLGQQFVVMGLHFWFLRVLILLGLMRVFLRGEHRGFEINKVDKLLVVWALAGVVCGAIRGFKAEQIGAAYDAVGIYFLVRLLTKEPEDVVGPLRFLCWLSLLVAAVMCFEAATHKNPFAVMGGVPLMDDIRDGRARCQGPFQHPIVAGAYAASFFPLMIGLWLQGGTDRRAAAAGIIGCIIIIITAVSSGALMCVMAACIGLFLWRARNRMRLFRRAIVVILIALNMVMKVPVWWLIAKVSDLVGGGGWHRSFIIDLFVKNFGSWWLVGNAYTKKWAPEYSGIPGDPNSLDITNYYAAQGVQGGIWMFVIFIVIITCCFQIVGRLVHSEENLVWKRIFIWTIGVSLASYCTSFISSAVSNQSGVFWHWLLAVIVSLPAFAVSNDAATASDAEPIFDEATSPSADRGSEPPYSPNPA